MAIDLNCSGCGKRLRVPDDSAGKQARCPACGRISTVPGPENRDALFSDLSDNPFADTPAPSAPVSDNPYQPPSAPTAPFGPSVRPSEAVLATRSTRFFGALLDGLLTLAGGIPGGILFFATFENDDEMTLVGLFLMFAGMIAVAVVNWVMISQRGQSIAKRIMGMRIIIRDTGELPGFLRGVLLRVWVPAVINQACNLFALVDALWIFGDERRCLHDLIAGTIVIDVASEHLLRGERSPYGPQDFGSNQRPDQITHRTCPQCGAAIDPHLVGTCPYCHERLRRTLGLVLAVQPEKSARSARFCYPQGRGTAEQLHEVTPT
jgi:uncharacterized RDD family membrane protein YckC/RNA polymerase subunit RPABC4/transcription elongation factor Spt4